MKYSVITLQPIKRTSQGVYGLETRIEQPTEPNGVVYREGDICIIEDQNGTANSQEIFDSCPGLRLWKESYIREKGAMRLKGVAKPYVLEERESWFIQVEEAKSWLSNPAAETPMISAMADKRGISMSEMVNKITENNNLFRTACGQILGTQQALIDLIWTEQDFSVFINIGWD